MITTTRQAQRAGQQPDRRIDRGAERASEHSPQQTTEHATEHATGYAAVDVAEYVFATVNGRYEVHVVRRGAGAWAIRLRGYALHRDGCFWPVPDEGPAPGTTPTGTDRGSRRLAADAHGGEPTYRLDEAVARTLQALVRLP